MGAPTNATVLPTGDTNRMAGSAMPRDDFGRSIPVEQGFRHEDNTGGPVGTVGNLVSPLALSGFAPVQVMVPPGAVKVRIRVDDSGAAMQGDAGDDQVAVLIGLSNLINTVGAPGSAQPANAGSFPILPSDGVVERPVAGMPYFYLSPIGGPSLVWFEFLVLSGL